MRYSRGIGPNGFLTKEQILTYPREILGDCWIYPFGKNKEGYGQRKIMGKQLGMHRIVAHVFHGLDINNPDQLACHINECQSKSCFNPDHIYVGNRGGNLVDAYIKGTIVSPWKGRTNNVHTK